jgi:ABC-2 type transport system permease protein
MIVFGFAVNMDVELVKIAWLDHDHSARSRAVYQRFEGAPAFAIEARPESEAEAQALLDRGEVQAVVRIPAGFGADVGAERQAEVQILLDGANSNTAAIVASYASSVLARHNQELLKDRMRSLLVGRTQQGPVRLALPGVRPETRIWFNPELRSRNYFVPGTIVNIIMLVTLMLTAMSIVREKEIGTMEQIMVTPIRPIELMLGKTLPFAIIGIFDMALVTAIALAVFRVPYRGPWWLLVMVSALFLLSSLGAGLFLSTISQTQQQAMLGAFFFFQPAFMLSGFSFPIRNMPEAVQWLTYLNPMRYFMEIVRGLFLKGSSLDVLWPQVVSLAVFGTAILWFAALRFHKRLD